MAVKRDITSDRRLLTDLIEEKNIRAWEILSEEIKKDIVSDYKQAVCDISNLISSAGESQQRSNRSGLEFDDIMIYSGTSGTDSTFLIEGKDYQPINSSDLTDFREHSINFFSIYNKYLKAEWSGFLDTVNKDALSEQVQIELTDRENNIDKDTLDKMRQFTSNFICYINDMKDLKYQINGLSGGIKAYLAWEKEGESKRKLSYSQTEALLKSLYTQFSSVLAKKKNLDEVISISPELNEDFIADFNKKYKTIPSHDFKYICLENGVYSLKFIEVSNSHMALEGFKFNLDYKLEGLHQQVSKVVELKYGNNSFPLGHGGEGNLIDEIKMGSVILKLNPKLPAEAKGVKIEITPLYKNSVFPNDSLIPNGHLISEVTYEVPINSAQQKQ
ncbi:MAG: hypothetical protein KAK00_04160 [Nanoarchaeota archaeon]|nr:hypothetical protein [Nanoarchaeota archaeon]